MYTDVTRLADLAAYHAWTGNSRASLEWIERAFDVSPVGVWGRILNTSLFSNLRSDPEAAIALETLTNRVWQRVVRESENATLP